MKRAEIDRNDIFQKVLDQYRTKKSSIANELFRLKVASKRQVTIPQRMLDVLGLSEGDEIQIEISNGQIVSTQACKSVPTAMLPQDLLAKINSREAEILAGRGIPLRQALRPRGSRKEKRSDTPATKAEPIA